MFNDIWIARQKRHGPRMNLDGGNHGHRRRHGVRRHHRRRSRQLAHDRQRIRPLRLSLPGGFGPPPLSARQPRRRRSRHRARPGPAAQARQPCWTKGFCPLPPTDSVRDANSDGISSGRGQSAPRGPDRRQYLKHLHQPRVAQERHPFPAIGSRRQIECRPFALDHPAALQFVDERIVGAVACDDVFQLGPHQRPAFAATNPDQRLHPEHIAGAVHPAGPQGNDVGSRFHDRTIRRDRRGRPASAST